MPGDLGRLNLVLNMQMAQEEMMMEQQQMANAPVDGGQQQLAGVSGKLGAGRRAG